LVLILQLFMQNCSWSAPAQFRIYSHHQMGNTYHLPITPDLESKLSFACDCLVPKEEPGYNCYCFALELLFNQTI